MKISDRMNKQGIFLFRWRSIIPVAFLIISFYLYTRMDFLREYLSLYDEYEIAALVLGLLGLAIRGYTIGYAGKRTSGRNTREQIADSLNTLDIYSTTRNPLYLGNFLMWLACVLMAGNAIITVLFLVCFWIFYERIIYTEEQFLTEKFGQEYLNYANKTPVFFPNLFKYKSSHSKFDWERVCIQEKNGLLALFLIFSMFEGYEIFAMYKDNMPLELEWDEYVMFGGSIFSIFLYIYFKILKKKKSIKKTIQNDKKGVII